MKNERARVQRGIIMMFLDQSPMVSFGGKYKEFKCSVT